MNQQRAPFQVDQLMSQVTDMVQRQFGLKPKNTSIAYRKPYPAWYDHWPLGQVKIDLIYLQK